ncbi:hypothetical protein ABZ690_30800 [Streptomyces sp. NPDC006967]|uniref:hypothetical protein n=1 Tax=unclassified Streptomyces TaxID=2593676 RepID=UPI0021562A68|nr:hypothetical protein [Streptomyces sp. SM1]
MLTCALRQVPPAPLIALLGRLDAWLDSLLAGWGRSSRSAVVPGRLVALTRTRFGFRDALGKQREEAGYDTQDDAIERLTQIYAEKKTTAPSVAEVRRELGQQTIVEYASSGVLVSAR